MLLWNIEYSSLFCTVGTFWLSILHVEKNVQGFCMYIHTHLLQCMYNSSISSCGDFTVFCGQQSKYELPNGAEQGATLLSCLSFQPSNYSVLLVVYLVPDVFLFCVCVFCIFVLLWITSLFETALKHNAVELSIAPKKKAAMCLLCTR